MIAHRASARTHRVSRLGRGLARRLDEATGAFGCVHSIFESAVNVLGVDGRLLTLHGPGPLAAPFAMALDSPLLAGAFEPGMAVALAGSGLVAGGHTLDWRDARVADLSIAPGDDHVALAAALGDPRLPAPASALASPGAVEARRRLAAAIRLDDGAALAAGALGLIGLGEGLTPAGDDCLVGVLAVAHRFRPALLRRHHAVLLAIAGAARERTTLVAREFLEHALDGTFSEPVIALMSALGVDEAARAAARLARMGATSGADTLAGMRLAVGALGAP